MSLDLRSGIADGVLDLIGDTPLVRLKRVVAEGAAEVCAKLESANPAGSVKDRPAARMLSLAEKSGALRPGATIVEATSGNTGISLAMLAAARGYRCILVMPDDMSLERRRILRAYGAEVVLTPAGDGMVAAVERARAIRSQTDGAWSSAQFENPANPEAHEATTAEEILRQTGGRLDAFVAGVGTGGTITGVARVLRARVPGVKIHAVEPAASPVLSGGAPGLHGIQGIGAGFVPANFDRALVDEIHVATDVAADRMARRLAREEGLLVGPSAGANVHVAIQVATELARTKPDGRVVTILCDSGERYLY
jgi:cysteine synthase A